jgi:PD-(D/E)XK nuclease superfamily
VPRGPARCKREQDSKPRMMSKIEIGLPAGKGIVDLIGRYKSFTSARTREAEQRAEKLKVELTRFWPQFEDARIAQRDRERMEASRFCLIRLLGVEELEKTHSRILADLLDPRGTHGQGSLFLEGFLDRIGLAEVRQKLSSSLSHVSVRSELAVTGEARPDIVISCVPWFIGVIENKIRSGEGYEQLKKYRAWLSGQRVAKKRLVYLTIYGRPSLSGAEDCSLSYARDVRLWLGACLKTVVAPAVEHALQRYLEVIAALR